MGVIERPIERLGPADTALCLALSSEAGWNQTQEDWVHFLRHGSVYGRRGADGGVVATSALLPYGGGSWLSLVLVTPGWQRQGIARALVERCLVAADATGTPTYLDATPAGSGIYQRLGFQPTCELVRLRRNRVSGAESPDGSGYVVEGERTIVIAELVDQDRTALGLHREGLLKAFAAREETSAVSIGTASCLLRRGSRARHMGPVYGSSQDDVDALLTRIAQNETGEIVIDVYAHQDSTIACLAAAGFVTERRFQRMARGAGERPTFLEAAHASAGPEYG